ALYGAACSRTPTNFLTQVPWEASESRSNVAPTAFVTSVFRTDGPGGLRDALPWPIASRDIEAEASMALTRTASLSIEQKVPNAAMNSHPTELVTPYFESCDLSGKRMEPRIAQTVHDLEKRIQPRVVAPGHCTGWRAK